MLLDNAPGHPYTDRTYTDDAARVRKRFDELARVSEHTVAFADALWRLMHDVVC